jgi:hypothetical protein
MLEFKVEIVSQLRCLLGINFMLGQYFDHENNKNYLLHEFSIGLIFLTLVVTHYKEIGEV